MAFKKTNWEFSKETEIVKPAVQEGNRTFIIENASFDETTNQYTLDLRDLENDASLSLRYWLDFIDRETGNIRPNTSQRGTLISLGKALAGETIGIPHPNDVMGGVVVGVVKFKKTEKGEFARIYEFKPACKSAVENASIIEQYSVPDAPDESE